MAIPSIKQERFKTRIKIKKKKMSKKKNEHENR